MLIKRLFSATNILNTDGSTGFIRGRKYDTDLHRLERESTQRELTKELGKLRKESRQSLDINKERKKEMNKLMNELKSE